MKYTWEASDLKPGRVVYLGAADAPHVMGARSDSIWIATRLADGSAAHRELVLDRDTGSPRMGDEDAAEFAAWLTRAGATPAEARGVLVVAAPKYSGAT